MNSVLIFGLLIAFGVLFLWFIYRKNFKIIKTPSVCLVTGGVKCGKTECCVYLSIKTYKKRYRVWWFKTHILRKVIEKPLFYTNAYITFGNGKKPHRLDKNIRLVTTQSLLRNERYNYGSVIYIEEASLLADNMDFRDVDKNIDLSLYAKLIGHETRGGCLFLDTQSVLDVHYAFKRVSSTYFFIQKRLNMLLFDVLYVREMINTENGVNNFTDDVDCTTRKVLIPFWYHHKYDRYEYSYLTDDLKSSDKRFGLEKGLVSFNNKYIERGDKRIKEVKVISKEEKKEENDNGAN